MKESPYPFVSVVIPVFNDSGRLRLCLESLEKQTYPKNLYEVITVNNNSDEDIENVAKSFAHTVIAFEARAGSYVARNKGISLAKGDVIAFTDSDCRAAADWIEKGVAKLLSKPDCGLVAGRIDFSFKNPNRPTVIEVYDSILRFRQKRYVEERKFGVTANIFTFKKVIGKVGVFDDSFKSCGDIEWGQRVFSSGYTLVYGDDVRVVHPAARSLKEVCKEAVRVAGGYFVLKKRKRLLPGDSFSMKTLIEKAPSFFNEIILSVWQNNKISGILRKLKVILLVFFIVFFVRCVRFLERARLALGGKPKRK